MQPMPVARCGRCKIFLNLPTARPFTTSLSHRAIGPESPSWLEVPEPVQSPKPPQPFVKGTLPIPRKIIKDQTSKYKVTTKHLSLTAKTPKPKPPIPITELRAYKKIYDRNLSSTRRESLKEGIQGLFQRRVQEAEQAQQTRQKRRERRNNALVAPERLDELLTRDSIPPIVKQALEWTVKNSRDTRKLTDAQKLEKRQAYDAVVEERMRKKMDSIHQLYINAKDFIVNPDQLNAEIEKVFGADDNPVVWENSGFTGVSPWIHGAPQSLKDMVGEGRGLSTNFREENTQAMSRIMKIAGELTGGKIIEPKKF